MLWNLLQRLTGRRFSDPAAVTPERLGHVFEWSKVSGYIGTGIPRRNDLAGSIRIQPEAETFVLRKDFNGRKAGETVEGPAHLDWTHVPRCAQIVLVGGAVAFRYAGRRELWPKMPPAGPLRARLIAGYFEDWYEFLELPDSIARLREEAATRAAKQRPGEGKLTTIRRYLSGEIDIDDLSSAGNVLMWVDWRASDDEIVADCEELIGTGKLSAEFTDNADRAELIISHGAKRVNVPYPAAQADRDTTLITLARVISGSYGLRFAVDSDGSDTLAFLPLKKPEWAALEREFPDQVAAKFRTVEEGAAFFN